MNKTVKKVFMLIALLVAIFLAWQIFFNKNGILRTAYNALANGINGQFAKVAGEGNKLLPLWDDSNADKNANGEGFNIDTTSR